MSRIGALSIPDASIVKSIIAEWALLPSKRGYVAPTVFLEANSTLPRINYYSSLDKAFSKLKFLKNAGGKDEDAAGAFAFKKEGQAITIGINTDFYIVVSPDKVVNVTYGIIKLAMTNGIPFHMVFRFYKKADGSGPYYAIFANADMGVSATTVKSSSPEKVAALDNLYREVAILKANYNGFVSVVNKLAAKSRLTPEEEQLYKRANNARINMLSEMSRAKELEISFSKDGAISNPLLLPVLVWIAIAAIVTAWAVTKIVQSVQNTKRINAGFAYKKWSEEEELTATQLYNTGKITKAQYDDYIANLRAGTKTADQVITDASKNTSMFGDIGNILKWGIIGFVAIKGMDLLKTKKAS